MKTGIVILQTGDVLTQDEYAAIELYMRRLLQRIEQKTIEYKGAYRTLPLESFPREVSDELLDICGWSIMHFCRLQEACRDKPKGA